MSGLSSWTRTQDDALVAQRTAGASFAIIARGFFPAKTASMCKRRFYALSRVGSPIYRPDAVRADTNRGGSAPAEARVAISDSRAVSALAEKTNEYYRREAKRRGTSVEAVRIALNYSPADIRAHMARAA